MSTKIGDRDTKRLVAMLRKSALCFSVLLILCSGGMNGQQGSDFRVIVSMVQLNVAVTDNKGEYITGLRPEDFVITEDGITEKLATFAEGDAPVRNVGTADAPLAQVGGDGDHQGEPATLSSLLAGSNVFV